jgi:hypothetical protein
MTVDLSHYGINKLYKTANNDWIDNAQHARPGTKTSDRRQPTDLEYSLLWHVITAGRL